MSWGRGRICPLVMALCALACDRNPPPDTRGQGAVAAAPSGSAADRPAEAGPPQTPQASSAPLASTTWSVAMVTVGPGAHRSPFSPPETPELAVPAFRLAERQVTNAEFLAFVRARPEWQRGRAPALFVDDGYLRHWAGPLDLGDAPPGAPVTNVSWFAARAYARSVGLRLPTEAEWELAAAASADARDARKDPAFKRRILDWYGRPAAARLPDAGQGEANVWGARDLHGLVWEWVDDFDAALLDGDLRGAAGDEAPGVCGAGAAGAEDATDYAAFMRYAMRTALRARYSAKAVGFRLAGDLEPGPAPATTPTSATTLASTPAAALDLPGDSLYQLARPLVGADGQRTAFDRFRGHPVVVSMFYGTCPAACPMLIEDARALMAKLEEGVREKVRVLFISFDPARDDPALLTALTELYSLDPARWAMTAASADDARELAAALGIRYRPRAADGGFDHTSSLVVLDPRGVEVARVDGLGEPVDAAVARLRELAGVSSP